jgi:hypothetical protein
VCFAAPTLALYRDSMASPSEECQKGNYMNTKLLMNASLLAAALLGYSYAQAGAISHTEYSAEKTRIKAEYDAADTQCGALAGNAKDVCVQEAKGNRKVALANLEYRNSNSKSDGRKAMTAKSEAEYAVAKEKCGALAGSEKDVCVQQAKAEQTKALADIKLGKVVGEARTDAANDSRDADYKVAIDICDSYSGDAKSNCVTAAKAKFGKS